MTLFENNNRVCALLGIQFPIVQGGMVYNSGAKLAAAVSNAGGLGLISAGSMRPDLFAEQIRKAKKLTDKPIGVNLPLLFTDSRQCLEVALAEGIKIFFTSAGSPKRAIGPLKKAGCVVVHVAASPALAIKCEDAGCDAVVVEGFEAGGHNGRDEITTMVLVPECVRAVKIPVIAAGGIATGEQIVAAIALGAQGVQIGSRFAITAESSGHANFKDAVVEADAGDTRLVLKAHAPVRLLKNKFYEQVVALESKGASAEDLAKLLGNGRARAGMLEGDLENGELEIGQVAGLIDDIPTVANLMSRLIDEYRTTLKRMCQG